MLDFLPEIETPSLEAVLYEHVVLQKEEGIL